MSTPPWPLLPLIWALGLGWTTATAQPAVTADLPRVEIIAVSPLVGLGVPKDQVPANVQTSSAADIERRGALDLASHLNRTLASVSINETQGNPLQPDLNFRGFSASPLLGTPQGLSVYLDGMRMNQPFGDVVSWDLIPRAAISTVTLMPGSNPMFGLNTLGGALAVQTKDGLKNPGSSVQMTAGSQQRMALEFESGGSADNGLNWFVTGNRFHEKGWRATSPSAVSQLFAKLGAKTLATDWSLSSALADNDLVGNGLQEQAALARDYRSSYTTPDQTRNRAALLNLAASHRVDSGLTLSGNVYYRQISTHTLNGDINDEALTAAPGEVPNGLLNRTQTRQHNTGAALQASARFGAAGITHQLLIGAAFDASRVQFLQSATLGQIAADRQVLPLAGAGDVADARVALRSRSQTSSVYASDTVALNPQTHLTLAGRYNRNTVNNSDGITPGGGVGSLDGRYTFAHFNPAVGITFAPSKAVTVFGGINQGTRAPTAVELGCADPASPCKLPNAFAGDPPLKQVVTTSIEAGVRGTAGGMTWNLGLFRADNRDDLLFVADNASGYGYFKNFGKTRRQGLEAGLSIKAAAAWTLGANLSLLDATTLSAEVVGGAGNSSNDAAAGGFPGVDGTLAIKAGDRIPLLPRQQLKLFADWDVSAQWRIGADLNAFSASNARGNENGQHQPDGSFYAGPGRSAGYAVLNMNADYKPTQRLKFFVNLNNLLDRRYSSAAQLGANAFDTNGNFTARPLPRDANGDYPVRHATFFAPGAPRAGFVGLSYALAN